MAVKTKQQVLKSLSSGKRVDMSKLSSYYNHNTKAWEFENIKLLSSMKENSFDKEEFNEFFGN